MVRAPRHLLIVERQDFQIAREHWQENKDPLEASKLFPRGCVAEHALLSHFNRVKNTTDCEGAIKQVSNRGCQ
jgi:hypothetical protein